MTKFVDLVKDKKFFDFSQALSEKLNQTRNSVVSEMKASVAQSMFVNESEDLSESDVKHSHKVGDTVAFNDGKSNIKKGKVLKLHGASDIEIKGHGKTYVMPHYHVKAINESDLSEEDLNEISKQRLGAYVTKSKGEETKHDDLADKFLQSRNNSIKKKQYDRAETQYNKALQHGNKANKRGYGVHVATKKLAGSAKVNASESYDSLSIDEMVDLLSVEDLESFVSEMEAFEADDTLSEAELNEISKQRLGAYVKKASDEKVKHKTSSDHSGDMVRKYKSSSTMAGFAKDAEKNKAQQDRKFKNRSDGISKAVDKLTKEELSIDEMVDLLSVEDLQAFVSEMESISSDENISEAELNEISKQRLGAYVKKASDQVNVASHLVGRHSDINPKPNRKLSSHARTVANKRLTGISKAVDKLTKEEVESLEENWDKGRSSSYVSDKVAANKHLQIAKDRKNAGDTVGYHKAMAKFEKHGYHGNHPMAQSSMAAAKASVKKHLDAAKSHVSESDSLEEASPTKLSNYLDKASSILAQKDGKYSKRQSSLGTAVNKLSGNARVNAKEEVEVTEGKLPDLGTGYHIVHKKYNKDSGRNEHTILNKKPLSKAEAHELNTNQGKDAKHPYFGLNQDHLLLHHDGGGKLTHVNHTDSEPNKNIYHNHSAFDWKHKA